MIFGFNFFHNWLEQMENLLHHSLLNIHLDDLLIRVDHPRIRMTQVPKFKHQVK